MEEINEWQSVWRTADTRALPSAEEMKGFIRRFLQKRVQKKWMMIIAGFVLAMLVIAVLCIVPFHYATSYIGGAVIVLSCLGISYDNARSLQRFYQFNDSSNTDFLAFIEKTRQNQLRYHQQTLKILLTGFSVGMGLYLYEPALRNPVGVAGMYIVFAVYVAVCWLVIRPRVFMKGGRELDRARERMEKLQQQLSHIEKDQL